MCGEVGSLLIILLHSSNWVRRWKNCENRSIFRKDMHKSIVSPFLTHGVHALHSAPTCRGSHYIRVYCVA